MVVVYVSAPHEMIPKTGQQCLDHKFLLAIIIILGTMAMVICIFLRFIGIYVNMLTKQEKEKCV